MNNTEITPAAKRILSCLNQMLAVYYWKAKLRPEMPNNEDLDRPYIALENACLDSSLFAIRAFDDFCRSKRNHKDDLIASDFDGFTYDYTGIPKLQRSRINKLIAHLTNMDIQEDVHCYPYRDYLAVVIDPAIAFCDYLITSVPNDDGLHNFASGTKLVIESVFEEYVN